MRTPRLNANLGAALGLSLAMAGNAALADDRPDIVIAVEGLFRTMEPIDGNSTTGGRVHPNIYDMIVARNYLDDPEGNLLEPAIATSWATEDNMTWRFTIREGVLFHNGDSLTARDVAFTLSEERAFGPDALVPAARRFTDNFVRVEAVDDLTVEVELSVADPNLPYRFITPLGYVVPMDHYLEVGLEAFGQMPVGTGPYKVVEFDSTSHIRLEAFDAYWGGTPPARSIEFRVVPEYSARLAGMVAGEFDMMVNVPTDEVETLERYPNLTYIAKSIPNVVMLAYNTLEIPEYGPNPVADRKLRYAMTAAIDRTALVEALWGDATFAPAPFNLPEFTTFFDPEVKPLIGYDIEKARAYLAESDYDGEEVVINVTRNAFPNFQVAVEFLEEQWRNLGVNVRLNVVDSWALALQHPFSVLNMSMSTEFDGTPTRAIWGFWGPNSARATREADRSWAPPAAFVEAGEKYLVATDPDERIALFREMVRIWEVEQPAIMLWRNVANWVVRDGLDWRSINSTRMPMGPGFLTVEN